VRASCSCSFSFQDVNIVCAGEMFTFGYSQTPPYITYRVISKDGYMHDPVPITISNPIMVHDFAITENYAIFMDLPVYFRPMVLPFFLFI
jgi:carotenoid cleavage dioxygenase-like enzyme